MAADKVVSVLLVSGFTERLWITESPFSLGRLTRSVDSNTELTLESLTRCVCLTIDCKKWSKPS